jgi:hypothetical protein
MVITLICFAAFGYLIGMCCALFCVVEKQQRAIKQAKQYIMKLQTQNEDLFFQQFEKQGIYLQDRGDPNEH